MHKSIPPNEIERAKKRDSESTAKKRFGLAHCGVMEEPCGDVIITVGKYE